MNTVTYRLTCTTRDLLTGEEVVVVLLSGLGKAAARKALARYRLSNVTGADALALGRSQVAQMEAEAVAA